MAENRDSIISTYPAGEKGQIGLSFIDLNRNGVMDPYENAALPIPVRVADLLSRMTLEEKIAQLLHPWVKSDADVKEKYGRVGLGALYVFWLQDRNDLQRYFIENSRLGIPISFVQEGLHGGAAGGAIFPMPVGMGCSWNTELVARVHAVIAKESRAIGANHTLSPNIDVHTDPRFGRVEEGWGEDPYLTSSMAVAAVQGLQGERLYGDGKLVDAHHIAATAKHFAAYGKTENGQDGSAADLSERTLREVYLKPFQWAVKAGLLAVMPAHNEINGVPCHANRWLLQQVLQQEWGFNGLIVSDYSDTVGLVKYGLADTPADAAALALRSGVDIDLGARAFGELLEAAQCGKVPLADIDRAVTNVLSLKFATGLFEHPYTDPKQIRVLDCTEHRELALEAARQSIVLLRNEGNLLPLSRSLRSIAVVGPNANQERSQLGGYTQYGASVVTILEGLKRAVDPSVRVEHAVGCHIMDDDLSLLPEAVEKAQSCDVAVVVVGDSKTTCQESWGGDAGDRTGLDLSGGQLQLVQAIYATGVPVVVVLINGRPHSIPWVTEHIPAIVEAWRPGEEGGTAVAEVLFGDINPSGKLNFTVPRSVGQLPTYYYRKVRQYNGRKYTFEKSSPLFPFGFGLSYTEFTYENLRVPNYSVPLDGEAIIEVDVRNTGKRFGAEVVQLYVRDEQANVTRPMRELKGFQRVELAAGEVVTVQFRLPIQELRYYDLNMNFTIEPGCHEIWVGGSSASGLTARFAVGGMELRPPVVPPIDGSDAVPTPETM